MKRLATTLPIDKHSPRCHLILHVLVAQLQLHDVFEGPEERLVKVEVRKFRPARQHFCQNVMDEGNGLLGNVTLFVTGRLEEEGKSHRVGIQTV